MGVCGDTDNEFSKYKKCKMPIRTTLPLRLFKISPLVSFKPGAGVVYHPTVHDAHLNETLRFEKAVKKGTTISSYTMCIINLNFAILSLNYFLHQ